MKRTRFSLLILIPLFLLLGNGAVLAAACDPPTGAIEILNDSPEVLAGETINLRVTGFDEYDIEYLAWSHQGEDEWNERGHKDNFLFTLWDPRQEKAEKTFKIKEKEPGIYFYSARIADSDINQTGCTESHIFDIPESVGVKVVESLKIITTELPERIVGEYYEFTYDVRGGFLPYTWEEIGEKLPEGLSFNNGTISGTPVIRGATNYNIRVTDDEKNFKTTGILPLIIKTATLEITTENTDLPYGGLNVKYPDTQLNAHGGQPFPGGQYKWQELAERKDGLPDGLELYPDGVIRGTPTEKETFVFVAQVTDANEDVALKDLTIAVTACNDLGGSCRLNPQSPEEGCCQPYACEFYVCVEPASSPEAPSPPGTAPPSGKVSPGELQVEWPDSPMGTSLNGDSELPVLIRYLYEWGIALGGLAAFIALLIAGIQYLTSFGDPVSMKDAMGRIQSAFFGLILLLSSWLILNTINPDLTTFHIPPIELPEKELKCKTDNDCKKFGEYYKCTETAFKDSPCTNDDECVARHGDGHTCFEAANYCVSTSANKFCIMDFSSQFEVKSCEKATINTKTVTNKTITVDGGCNSINIGSGESFTVSSFPDDCMGYLELYPGNLISVCGGEKQSDPIRGGTIMKKEIPEGVNIKGIKIKKLPEGF